MRKLRPIITKEPPVTSGPGAKSRLEWLQIHLLVVDDRYQRSIAHGGRANVIRILTRFDWSKFAPVVVTPVEDGFYAIIDGQHRATAALMHPAISSVPCMVVDVTPDEAAACFAAINGQVTAITRTQIHHARVTAGDADAVGLQDALRAADVRVMKYKTPQIAYAPGDTLAIGALEKCFARYGRDTLVTALQSVTMSGDGNAGCLAAPLIWALCEILHDNPEWRESGSRLLEVMDELALADFIADASAASKKCRRPAKAIMKERLVAHFAASFAPRKQLEAVS